MKKNNSSESNRIINNFQNVYRIISTIFLVLILISNSSAQGDEDWYLLDDRMECVITEVAQEITGDDQHAANRSFEFDTELVDPALAWEWNITNPYTGDFYHWISGGVFKDSLKADEWWKSRGLHRYYFDNSNENIGYWDGKDSLTNFHGELAVLKYRGFDHVGVEGTMWWKRGRFIFRAGNITKPTKDSLVNLFLWPAMEKIYQATEKCELFSSIVKVDYFVFENVPDVFYLCDSKEITFYPMDENDRRLEDFQDQVTVSIVNDGHFLLSWDLNHLTSSLGNFFKAALDFKIPSGVDYNNIELVVQYQDVLSATKIFDIKQLCIPSFLEYPEEIKAGYNWFKVEVENRHPGISNCIDVQISALNPYKTEYPSPNNDRKCYFLFNENELKNLESIQFVLHGCNPSESHYDDIISIPVKDAIVVPDDGFDDVYIFGGEDDDFVASIEAGEDPTEILVTGQFAGSAAFVDTDLLSDGPDDVYIGKWNYASNKFEWLQKMGSTNGVDQPVDVNIDKNRLGYYTTFISGEEVILGPEGEVIKCPPGNNIIQVKSKITGEIFWAVNSGPVDNDFRGPRSNYSHRAYDTEVDNDGNVFITGKFNYEISFTGKDGLSSWSALANNSDDNLFLVKISDQGEILWGFHTSGNEDVRGKKLAVDSGGNVYLAAYYNESVLLEGYTFNEDRGAFIAKFNASGDIQWLMNINELCIINDLVLDNNDEHLFMCGRAKENCDFGGYVWESPNPYYSRLFYGKVTADGETSWIKHGRAGRLSSDFEYHSPLAMDIDRYNNIYLTGFMQGSELSFSDIQLIPDNYAEMNQIIFVAAFDEDGNILWADKAADNPPGKEDNGNDEATSISLDDQGNIYIAGTIRDKADFGDGEITGFGENDAFIARVFGGIITGLDEVEKNDVTENSILLQNYPNPVSTTSRIDYKLQEETHVKLDLFNAFGIKVQSCVDERQMAGKHTFVFDGRNFSPGIYYYRLNGSKFKSTKKLIILR